MEKNYVELIQATKIFQSSQEVAISYDFTASEYAELIGKYHFEDLLQLSDAEKVMKLLAWVNKQVRHRGNYDNSDVQDALTLLGICCKSCEKDFDKGCDQAIDVPPGVNCLALSIILCECLLAAGVKARVVYMMPKAVEDGDNHVVVEAFVSEWNKWIMLDATYGSYCVDKTGVALNLKEIRDHVSKGIDYSFSEGINYNGNQNLDIDDIKEYYAKNLFFLRCKSKQGYGEHRTYGNMLEIAPADFDVQERMVCNIKYRIQTYGAHEIFTQWLQYESQAEHAYINMEQFYK